MKRRILCLLLAAGVALAACSAGTSNPVTAVPLGADLQVLGSVEAGFDFRDGSDPHAVVVYSFAQGAMSPSDTTTLVLDQSGNFSGTVPNGAAYRLDIVDAAGEVTSAGIPTGIAVDQAVDYGLVPQSAYGEPSELEGAYRFEPTDEDVSFSMTITPNDPSNPLPDKMYLVQITAEAPVVINEYSLSPNPTTGVAVVSGTAPFVNVDASGMAAVYDNLGNPVAVSFSATVTWGGQLIETSVLASNSVALGGPFFNPFAGLPPPPPEPEFKKKTPKGKKFAGWLYLVKIGNFTSKELKDNPNCHDCPFPPKAPDPNPDGSYPSGQTVRKAPTNPVCDDGGPGLLSASKTVAVTCQEHINEPEGGARTTSVQYNFIAYEPHEGVTGKLLDDWYWFQFVKTTTTAYNAAGEETEIEVEEWGYDTGSGAPRPNAYPYYKTGQSDSKNDAMSLTDQPKVPVPQTDAEEQEMAQREGYTLPSDWVRLVTVKEFVTCLICCDSPPTVGVCYSWTQTVTIHKSGTGSAATYSSSLSTETPEQVDPDDTPSTVEALIAGACG